MKKIILGILVPSLFLVGCQLKENYALQASFTNEVITKINMEVTSDGVKVDIPFADFSCEPESFKPILERKSNDFIIILEGNETSERCSSKFSAKITGISSGTYWLKVVYKKGEEDQRILYEEFKVE